ncbi:hypothetical protein [Cognatishimia sp. MH4019]|uniref:hypothetical protein n=1 Tax=Cognatishimia sp. MH4019 TaxID=2854030 RepID=UPI001CD41433|nr:hypothetical protein [Cognatishimia sp. MH4019]
MEPFEHHVTGRDPFFIIMTLIGVAMVAGAVMMDAPWWILAIWGLSAILLVWRTYTNPKSGLTLDAGGLHYYGDGIAGSIELADIARVEIIYETDGPDLVLVHLTDGERVSLPRESYPVSHKLRTQLARFNIIHNPI